ncbi:GIY-YIG nuclease family protein [Vibrio rumoiensis]|uniref:Endonuclease n=1 Tax=Vibrio rumoiensis 1S-45 TaxID=1188252 RepID=A0A1E5DYQ4_9VIBR|nr:GIY-YIG nuclease family protein [Vibrio rumoiensis]OEF22720.1 endonuclease [Vibrio rumoiensis 1S-45]
MDKQPCVYILSSPNKKVLYIGVTSQLKIRVWQHKKKQVDGFTQKYDVNILVYYEIHETMQDAIYKEKQLKRWKRGWKNTLIESMNPNYEDLFEEL